MREEFDKWYDKTFGRFGNYMSPMMRDHAWVAWCVAWEASTEWHWQRFLEFKARIEKESELAEASK